MGLQVACPGCGKKLAVKQELLGKKIKCPECQTLLALSAPKTPAVQPAPAAPAAQAPTAQVPAARPAAATPSAAQAPIAQNPAPAPATGGKISVVCSCGSKLRVPASAAGKKVRCPKCQSTIPVVAPADETVAPIVSSEPGGLGDGFPAFDQGAFGAAPADPLSADPLAANPLGADPLGSDPLGAGPLGAPADPLGAPAPVGADPFGAPGNVAWDDLPGANAPTAPAQFPSYATPAAPASGARRDEAALAAAGAYQPSLEEKVGGVVSQLHQAEGRSWGDYFGNRIHLAILAMMVFGPVVAFFGWQTKQKLAALEAKGVTVPGIIMEGEERHSRRSRTYTFVVEYETKEGVLMEDEFKVNKTFFNAHIAGDMIGNDQCEVLYNPDDPTEAVVVGGSTDNSASLYIGLVMFVLGTGGFCYTIFVGDIDF